MATNPTNEELMAYLYGELSETDHSRVETWLKKNPEALKEIEDLRAVRGIMSHVQDQEVIDPFFYYGKGTASIWQTTRIISNAIIKPAIGLAASISLVILLGFLTDFNLSTENGSLSVSFGSTEPVVEKVDEAQIQLIVQQMLEKEKKYFTSDVESIESGLKTQLASYYEDQNNQLQNALNSSTQTNNEALAEIVKQMQEDNLNYMERYLDLASRSQQQNLEMALTEFSDFLATQREEDLNRIQYNLTTLKESQDQQKLETEEILATILNTVNNRNNN